MALTRAILDLAGALDPQAALLDSTHVWTSAPRTAPQPRGGVKVARIISRLNVGGPARHCLLLGEGLRRHGFETVLITGELEAGEADVLPGDASATAGGVRIVRVPGLRQKIAPGDDLRALLRLVAVLRRERPDIVHTHTSKAGALGRLAAALAGVPIIVHTFHGHVLEGYFPRLPSALIRLAERALARLSSRLITLSPALEQELSGRHHVADGAKIDVIPLGRDLAPFHGAPRGRLRTELGLDAATPLVGAVGRLVPIKDVPLLVRAFARVLATRPDAHLVLAGDGPERAAIEAVVRERGLGERVHLLGWRDDLPALYADLDLLVVSSKNEGTPLAMIEAFAAGVPVVATRVGGVPDMFDAPSSDGVTAPPGVDLRPQGALVASGDEAGVAAAIDRLLGDAALRQASGAAARVKSEDWSASRLIDDTARLYRELLAARR